MLTTAETVSTMTVAEFRALIEEVVREQLIDLFSDSDEGLELRPEVRERLLAQQNRVQQGERGISLDEVVARLDL